MDFLSYYYFGTGAVLTETEVTRAACKKAFALVLPYLMKQELTERQYLCIRYTYDSGKSQEEIASLLHLSQPTVSRHLRAGKRILNRELKYIYAAVTAALAEYERLAQSCG